MSPRTKAVKMRVTAGELQAGDVCLDQPGLLPLASVRDVEMRGQLVRVSFTDLQARSVDTDMPVTVWRRAA